MREKEKRMSKTKLIKYAKKITVIGGVAVAIVTQGTSVLAADDPLAVINNLSTFVFSIIRAIGMILLGWGIVQIGLALKSHDPSQRANRIYDACWWCNNNFCERNIRPYYRWIRKNIKGQVKNELAL